MVSLMLLPAEADKLQSHLGDNLNESYMLESETLTSFESAEQLRMRFHRMNMEPVSAMKTLIQRIVDGAKIEDLSIEDIPDELLPKFYFTIGARGVSALLWDAISQIETPDDLDGLESLATIRHELLVTNAS